MARTHSTVLPAPTGGMLLAKRPTGITMALVVILIAMVLQGLPAMVEAAIIGIDAALNKVQVDAGGVQARDSVGRVMTLFLFGACILWLWFWLRVKERRGFATLGFTAPRRGVKLAAQGVFVGLVMIVASVLIPVLGGQAQLGWGSPSSSSWMFIVVMLLGFLVQGSTEEILTRGYLTQAVARRWGLVAAVIFQAAFFTLLHGANPGMGAIPIINLILFACFASFMSLAQGSLWGVCAMHGIWNWAQGNLFGVAVSGTSVADSVFTFSTAPGANELLTGGQFGIEGSLGTSLVYLVGIALTWKL